MKALSPSIWLVSLFAATPLCAAAGHQSSVDRPLLEETLVSVTRSARSDFDSPHSVQLLSAQQLEQQLPRSLPEALRELPGVMVQKTANGQGSPFIRGFTGYRTLVLIDGIRYNNSVYRDGPNEYFSLIDLGALEQLELLAGPASAAYGSDAIGGTLSLQTKAAGHRSQPGGELFVTGSHSYRYGGAENSHSARTELALGEGGRWGLRLGHSDKRFDDIEAAELGVLPTTGYGERGIDARLDTELNAQWRLTLVHQQLAQDDVWRTHATVFAQSFVGTQPGSDRRRLKDQRRQLDYVRLAGRDLSGWLDRATLTVSQQRWREEGERQRRTGSRIDEHFESQMTGFDLQLQTELPVGQLVYGVDVYRDRVDSGRTDFNQDGSLDRMRIQGPVGDDARYDLSGLYLQGEFALGERWSLTASSRYAMTEVSIGAYEDPATQLAARFASHWRARVNALRVSYQFGIDVDWHLWGGASQSFRAPNIADLSRFGKSRSSETEVAATDLDPERFLTYELGVKARGDRFGGSATAYHTEIRDYIASTPTGRIVDGLTEVSKQNSSSGFVAGIELSADWQLAASATLVANITWLNGDLDVYPVAGAALAVTEPISRLMPLTANLSLQWQGDDGDYWARLDTTWADRADRLSSADKQDLERIPPGGTPGYTLIDLMAGHRINDYLGVTLGVTNLLDEAYRNHGSGTNEPGRGVTAGVKLRF